MRRKTKLRVVKETEKHRLSQADNVESEAEARGVLNLRTRERFLNALRAMGLRVSETELGHGTYQMTDAQRRLVLRGDRELGALPAGTTINDFAGWICVPYLFRDGRFYVFARNLYSLDDSQQRDFQRNHLLPAIAAHEAECPGGQVLLVAVEPSRFEEGAA